MRLYSQKVPFLVPVVLLLAASLVSTGCSPAKMHTTRNSKMSDINDSELLGGPSKPTTTKTPEVPEPLKPATRTTEPEVKPPVETNPEQPGRIVTIPQRQTPTIVDTTAQRTVVTVQTSSISSTPAARRVVIVDNTPRATQQLRSNVPNTIPVPEVRNAKGTVLGPQISNRANTGCPSTVTQTPSVSGRQDRQDVVTQTIPAGCPPIANRGQIDIAPLEPVDPKNDGEVDGPITIYPPKDNNTDTQEIVNTLELVMVLDDDLLADQDPAHINRKDWKTLQYMSSNETKVARPRNYNEFIVGTPKLLQTDEFAPSRVSEIKEKIVPVLAAILKDSESKFKKIKVTIVNDYCGDTHCLLARNGVVTQDFLPELSSAKITNFELVMDVFDSHLNKEGAIKELSSPEDKNVFLRASKEFRGIQTLYDLINSNNGLNIDKKFGVAINERKKVMFMLITGATLNYGYDKPTSGFDDFEESMEFSDQCIFKNPPQRTWQCPTYSELGNLLHKFQIAINYNDPYAVGLIMTRPWDKLTGNDPKYFVREGQGFYALRGPISQSTANAFNLVASDSEFKKSKENALIKAIQDMMR